MIGCGMEDRGSGKVEYSVGGIVQYTFQQKANWKHDDASRKWPQVLDWCYIANLVGLRCQLPLIHVYESPYPKCTSSQGKRCTTWNKHICLPIIGDRSSFPTLYSQVTLERESRRILESSKAFHRHPASHRACMRAQWVVLHGSWVSKKKSYEDKTRTAPGVAMAEQYLYCNLSLLKSW